MFYAELLISSWRGIFFLSFLQAEFGWGLREEGGDAGELVGGEGGGAEGAEVVLELGYGAGADDYGDHVGEAQEPGEGHRGERFAALGGYVVEGADFGQQGGGEVLGDEVLAACHAGVGGDAAKVAVGEQALLERREGRVAHAVVLGVGDGAVVDVLLAEEVAFALVAEAGDVALLQIVVGKHCGIYGVARDADVESLAGADYVNEGLQRLLEGRLGVVAVAVEEVHVVYVHAAEALVERGEEVLAAAPFAVRAGPHVVAGLGGDEHLVAVGAERLVHESAEGLLGGAVHWAVVVGEVKDGDAVVEGTVGHGLGVVKGAYAAEIVPEAEAEGGHKDAALAASAVFHAGGISLGGGVIYRFNHNSFFSSIVNANLAIKI